MQKKEKHLTLIVAGLLLLVLPLSFSCMEPIKAYLSVQPQKCKSCGLCTNVCQVDAVRIINGKAVIDPTKCVECGRCVEVCPENAIY